MEHIVAVGTYWHKVFDRVEHIFFANAADRYDVVNVDKSFTNSAISLGKVATAYDTSAAEVVDALLTCFSIALIYVDKHFHNRAFVECFLVIGIVNLAVVVARF